jgi:glutamate--cysteine ligase
MASVLDAHLESFRTAAARRPLGLLLRGVEKESLRVLPSGMLSRAPHPKALGSALTHPQITTDFSEAQLELITGVHDDPDDCIAELTDIHRFVYSHLGDELLWASSMPCMLANEDEIPVGRYGTSNVGRTKTVYRLGLGARYGRYMQTISGVHYNFSIPDRAWPTIARARGVEDSQAFRTDAYFGLIRNFRRHSWLVMYLFGSSPSICKSFVKRSAHSLECFDEGSLYLPFATSLRMGRLGYQSDAQSNLYVSFNSFEEYAKALHAALEQPYPEYTKIGVKVNGEYRQLTDSLLQIENEFYGTIRPKRSTRTGERTLAALQERGVEYVEVRPLDLDPFHPAGIDVGTMRFLDVFLLHCAFAESEPDSPDESAAIRANQLSVVEEGRKPGLTLDRHGRRVEMRDWALELIDQCRPIAELLDAATGKDVYSATWAEQRARVLDPSRTPSARILETMRNEGLPFFRFAMNRSIAHKAWYAANPLSPEAAAEYTRRAEQSLAEQAAIEAADELDFDGYLAKYLRLPELKSPA